MRARELGQPDKGFTGTHHVAGALRGVLLNEWRGAEGPGTPGWFLE